MRPRWTRFAAVLLAVACSITLAGIARDRGFAGRPVSQEQEASLPPRVHLIATGGTISMHGAARMTADELLELAAPLNFARAEAEQFANTSSASLTLPQWLALARRINTVLHEDQDLAGVVVTTGTDTLEELAYFLNLTVRDERPVVVVGAMRHAGSSDSDARGNLVDGVRVAAAPQSRSRGVLAVLNGEIHAAREAVKVDATRIDAFRSPGGRLGIVGNGRVMYHLTARKRHTASSEFDVFALDALPRVDVVLVYQDASGDVIRALVDQGAQGLVIAGAGAGATSGTQDEGIRDALRRGVFVVMSTRTESGRVQARGAPVRGQAEAYHVNAGDLAPVKARVLLMLALAVTRDPSDVERIFSEY